MMKKKFFTFTLLLVSAFILRAQNPLMKELKKYTPKYQLEIKKKFDFSVKFKIIGQMYRNIELIPFLYLKNIELTQELLNSDEAEKNLMGALREQPTADNLRIPVNFPHYAIIYTDNLRVMDDYNGSFCITPPHAEALIKYFKKSKAQIIFYIWGLNDLFVLIENKIYKLVYDEGSNSYSKMES